MRSNTSADSVHRFGPTSPPVTRTRAGSSSVPRSVVAWEKRGRIGRAVVSIRSFALAPRVISVASHEPAPGAVAGRPHGGVELAEPRELLERVVSMLTKLTRG